MADAGTSTPPSGGLATLGVAILLAVGTVALGAAALISTGVSTDRPSAVPLLPVARAYAVQAEARLKGHPPTAQDYAFAESATAQELRLAPRSVDAYLRIAAIEVARDGGLTVKALNALRSSYALSPIDPDLWQGRIAFALEHWTELDDATRLSVRDEISATAHNRDAQKVHDTIMGVSNPTGQFAGLMSYSFLPTPPPAPAR